MLPMVCKIQDTSSGTDCSALANKINALIRLSINNFKAFQETLKNSDGLGFPETFSEDTVRPALLSHFHMGRLCDKYVGIPEISQEKLKNKLESYCHFKTIVDYCAKHDAPCWRLRIQFFCFVIFEIVSSFFLNLAQKIQM